MYALNAGTSFLNEAAFTPLVIPVPFHTTTGVPPKSRDAERPSAAVVIDPFAI
jgi:hypothetical protein